MKPKHAINFYTAVVLAAVLLSALYITSTAQQVAHGQKTYKVK